MGGPIDLTTNGYSELGGALVWLGGLVVVLLLAVGLFASAGTPVCATLDQAGCFGNPENPTAAEREVMDERVR